MSVIYKFQFDGHSKYVKDKWAYTLTGLLEYHGWAKRGSATSAEVWTIEKFSYDANSNPTDRTVSDENVAWDNYNTTVTYS